MTQLPTWVNEMQSKALAAMPSLKLPKADRTNINRKGWFPACGLVRILQSQQTLLL